VTHVKNKKKIKKKKKLTYDVDFNTVWSKLMTTMTKLNHFLKNKNQIETTKNCWRTHSTLLDKYKNQKSNLTKILSFFGA